MPGVHPEAFGHQFEMVDQCFHAHVQLGTGREAHLAVVGLVLAVGQVLHGLLDDAQALAHFLHAHLIARVAVAVGQTGTLKS